jgi:hypothetical protein
MRATTNPAGVQCGCLTVSPLEHLNGAFSERGGGLPRRLSHTRGEAQGVVGEA